MMVLSRLKMEVMVLRLMVMVSMVVVVNFGCWCSECVVCLRLWNRLVKSLSCIFCFFFCMDRLRYFFLMVIRGLKWCFVLVCVWVGFRLFLMSLLILVLR